MHVKGINYDTGTEYTPCVMSRDGLTPEGITADMQAIKNDLHANAVRLYGKDPQMLLLASGIALEAGLDVWLSPRLIDGDAMITLRYLGEIASGFEQLRVSYPGKELVFIVGGEITIDMNGFLPGNSIHARAAHLAKPFFFIRNALGIRSSFQKPFQQFLNEAAARVRDVFKGKITYASALWENIDWTAFDFISVNYYRASFNASFYVRRLRKYLSMGKPVVITEFGCCSYQGADRKGPTGYTVIDWTVSPPAFREPCERNEHVQADYILDLLQTYEREGVTGAFIFDFYAQSYPFSDDPGRDLDKAGFGITRNTGKNKWEPKQSFLKIAEFYSQA